MLIKPDLLYAPSHEWVRLEGDEAVLGITDFAQDQLGDLTYVDMPAVGDKVTQGEDMGSVESVKAASEIYSLVTGVVIAVNETLVDHPEKINTSPYDEGWLIRVKISSKPEGLLTAKEYEATAAENA